MKINKRSWKVAVTIFVALLLIAPASQAIRQFPEARAAGTLSTKVHIFYYPWYGLNPYRHWEQGGHTPPNDIGSDFYPVLGPYDSGDFSGAVTTHMQQIQQAGAGVIVLSWWGQGSFEDGKVTGIMDIANQYGIKVAFHIEPYGSRTASSVVSDVNYINNRYGSHPAYYRDAEHGNRPAFYVFETYRITDWSPIAPLKSTNIILQQTAEEFTQTPNFGGLYTYDGIAGTFAPGWAVASAYAQAHDLVWAPSVAPGYIDDRAVPGNTTPTVDRANGAAYDKEWQNVLNPANGQPTWISITSFNEWHEGSQIEPARNTPPGGQGYLTYLNAYGLTGSAAESAYITRTKHWVDLFDQQGSTRPQAPGILIATAADRQVGLTWEAASGATSYNVKRSAVSGGPYTTISSVTGTSFTDTNLTNGTPYFYAVWAVNGSGESVLATNQASAVPFSGANLVPNPGFETGSATNAASWIEGTQHTRIGTFKSGSWSLISNYSGTGSAQTLSPAIAIAQNTNYTLSGWIYVFKGTNPGRACIDLNGISGSQQLCTTTDMTQVSAWKYLSGTWNSGSNTSVTVRLLTDSNPYTTWFDDIRLSIEGGPTSTPAPPTHTPTKTPTPTITNTPSADGNLVLNAGFETAGGSAADAASWSEGANHARASDKFHTGGWSLRSTYRGAGTDTRTSAPIAVQPNTDYTYSGYIWRTNATGAACMDMADIVGERQLCASAAGSWQLLSGTWSSGSNTSVTLRLITDGSPTGDIWFDDIALVPPCCASTDPPQQVHLSWTGTDGVVDPSTTMNVTWSTTQTGDSIVRYGDSSSYGSQSTGTTTYSASLGAYVHSAKLTGLTPNQVYHYSAGSTALGYSSDFTFKTAPAKGTVGSYTIGVWSDTQNVGSNATFGITSGIVEKMIPYVPLFTLHAGDIVENGSSAQSMKDFLAVSQGLNATAPLMPVLGNHDLRNAAGSNFQAPYANFTDAFNLPGNELYYSFDYGNVHVTALDTGVANVATIDQSLFAPGTAQYDWLVNDLNAADNDPDITWKIVYMHFPPYTMGVSLVQYVQDTLAPIMDAYHVDLVISGHRHVYERSKSINGNVVVQPGPNYTGTPYGTIYVVAGTAGGAVMGAGQGPFAYTSWTGYDFAILNVNDNVLTYTAKSSADNNIDSFTITK